VAITKSRPEGRIPTVRHSRSCAARKSIGLRDDSETGRLVEGFLGGLIRFESLGLRDPGIARSAEQNGVQRVEIGERAGVPFR
jgi:hypothetical protein